MELALNKLQTVLQSANPGDDPLGMDNFVRMRSEINPRKINVGLATRRLITNGFKEYFRDAGDTSLAECWTLAAE